MRLLICTPAFGGLVHTSYLQSLFMSIDALREAGIDINLLTLDKESLIPRGRNRCAKSAMIGGYDKLMFIDADLSWTAENLLRVLQSDKKIVGGTYPIKDFPITLNLNPLEEHAKDFPAHDRQQDSYLHYVRTHADSNGEVEVFHLPTGFMCIDVSVLTDLAKSGSIRKYEVYDTVSKSRDVMYDFFPIGVVDERYVSEDWAFCEIAREAGVKIYLQTKAVCGHVGSWHYGLGVHIIQGQAPLIPDGGSK